ncbi:MAG: tetratricopeptide repeat protein [Beijerinckiaceae bacterium]
MRNELAAILASEPFGDSPQLRAFLAYVVNETLDGRAAELKGYTIATMALGRPQSFDPQTDPIVRVQAGRVRQALTEYYAFHPQALVRLELPRGLYAPTFGWNAATSPPPQPALTPPSAPEAAGTMRRRWVWPALAAAAAIALGAAGLALQMGQVRQPSSAAIQEAQRRVEALFPTLVVEQANRFDLPEIQNLLARTKEAIARFDDLVLVGEDAETGPAVRQGPPPRRAWRMLLRLGGEPAGPDTLRIRTSLIDKFDQQVIWSREFDGIPIGRDGDARRTAVIRTIATVLAQPYGVIHAHVRANIDKRLGADDPYSCVIAGLDYWLVNDRKTHGDARACILDKLMKYPTFGALHAQLTYLHLEEYRQGYNPLPGDARARAAESARRAVQFRPASARSHQALLAALFATGDMDGAWRAAADALKLNPYDTEIIADVGSYHAIAGNFDKALELLNNAIELNPSPPAWVLTHRALALYMLGRLDQSGPAAKALEGSSYPLAMMALVMQAAQFRDRESGLRHLARFRQAHPDIAKDPNDFLRRANYDFDVATKLVFDYNRALNWIDQKP